MFSIDRLLVGIALLLGFLIAPASVAADFFPGTRYDPAVPTLERVVGHAPGERITSGEETRIYFDALEAAKPDQVRVVPYAVSWEGRELFYVILGSAETLQRLDAIKNGMAALADPRQTSLDEATALSRSLPGVVWLTYAVHGNEISSTDAGIFVAYHLLAAEGDAVVDAIMANTLVLIDPLQNPDGRARFLHGFEMAEGLVPDEDRLSAEHQEAWPGGRTNHYLFDMNRDWFALTQPETRGRVKVFQDWYPLAVVDAHEMGGDESYYFAPPAEPFNPQFTDRQLQRLTDFGKENARWFDRFGFDYFTRETFDGYYPGYGDSWPMLHGSIAMTFEQASARGLLWRRMDGGLLTYRDTVKRHVVSSLGTVETVASNREALLREFYDYRRSAIDEGRGARVRAYVLPVQRNRAGVDKLVSNLAAQGIESWVAGEPFKACKVSYDAGSVVIDAAQPAGRLLRTLMDPQTDMGAGFIAEQERRREIGLGHQLYDVTSWALPLMYGVQADVCNVLPKVGARGDVPANSFAEAAVAYLVPWQDISSVRFLTGLLRAGATVRSADAALVVDGARLPAGSLVVPVKGNVEGLHELVRNLSAETGAEVLSRNSSWVDSGPHFGSARMPLVHKPRIALAWDEGASPYSAGNTRFVLERQMGMPVTIIRTATLGWADLSHYDVLILPEQDWTGYGRMLGKAGAARLQHYVEGGGVLIGLGTAVRYLATPDNGLSALRREFAAVNGDDKPKANGDEAMVEGRILGDETDYRKWIHSFTTAPDTQPGALVNAAADQDHWMTAGLPEQHVLIDGRDIYAPLKGNEGANVATFKGEEDILGSGYLWKENRAQLAFKPFVTVEEKGRGLIISFTASPTERAYLDGLNLLFANAVLRGPAHAQVQH